MTHATDKKELKQEHATEKKELQQENDARINELVKNHKEDLEKLANDHGKQLEKLTNDFKEDLNQKDVECEHKDKKTKKGSDFNVQVIAVQKVHTNQWVRKNHAKFVASGCDNPHVIDTLARNLSFSNHMTGDIGEDTCRLLLLTGWTERTLCTECAHVQWTMPPVEVQGEIVREPATVNM